jgi:hypothetical protein
LKKYHLLKDFAQPSAPQASGGQEQAGLKVARSLHGCCLALSMNKALLVRPGQPSAELAGSGRVKGVYAGKRFKRKFEKNNNFLKKGKRCTFSLKFSPFYAIFLYFLGGFTSSGCDQACWCQVRLINSPQPAQGPVSFKHMQRFDLSSM